MIHHPEAYPRNQRKRRAELGRRRVEVSDGLVSVALRATRDRPGRRAGAPRGVRLRARRTTSAALEGGSGPWCHRYAEMCQEGGWERGSKVPSKYIDEIPFEEMQRRASPMTAFLRKAG